MATADGPTRVHGGNERRHPFSGWMKRLANLKGSSDSGNRWSSKRHAVPKNKRNPVPNTPYPLSSIPCNVRRISRNLDGSCQGSAHRDGSRPHSQSEPSLTSSGYGSQLPGAAAKSAAPTVSTNGGDTAGSDATNSKPGTMATAGGAISSHCGDEGSTFSSSPAPSVRSLTTTLTTVQSAAPSTQLQNAQNVQYSQQNANSWQNSGNQQVQFSHQFPPSPASAVPPHLAPHGHTVTYSTATANNVLTDNASVLTLASSSKRRRRNSLDTNASVRALAPSSVFGGSRESLPVSVLSGNVIEPSNASGFSTSGAVNRPSVVGLASSERVSVYSSGAGAVSGDRGSYYGSKQNARTDDGASIGSGAQSHARNDSNAASASGVASPFASPSINQPMGSGRISRRSSGWGEVTGDENGGSRQSDRDDEGPDDKGEATGDEDN